jgi:hypothetical protein
LDLISTLYHELMWLMSQNFLYSSIKVVL